MQVAVIVPVKSFGLAKGRLADTLSPRERAQLSQQCAERVVRAARPWPVYVVCSDAEIADWATAQDAHAVQCSTPGLDVAVAAGRAAAINDGADHLVVAHADLPLAATLQHIPREGAVSIVPDRHHDGTNVLSFPARSAMTTAYGPGSCDNHVALAHAAGLRVDIIEDADLSLDLDTADDLREFQTRQSEKRTRP